MSQQPVLDKEAGIRERKRSSSSNKEINTHPIHQPSSGSAPGSRTVIAVGSETQVDHHETAREGLKEVESLVSRMSLERVKIGSALVTSLTFGAIAQIDASELMCLALLLEREIHS